MDTEKLAKQIRIDAINMTYHGKASHIGSILSCADLIAVLYGKVLKYDVNNPKSENRDRFILSKGHAGVGVYSALARVGFMDPKKLDKYYTYGSSLSGHVSHKGNPGVECSTGSLGQGVTVACGLALAGKINKKKYTVYVIVGDGELAEGSVWEMAGFAGTNKLDNLVVIVDNNRLQIFGETKDIVSQENIVEKFRSFGFDVVTCDGHNHTDIINALNIHHGGKPLAVIAKTIKGKGVSFMENNYEWHGKTVDEEQYKQAIRELEGK